MMRAAAVAAALFVASAASADSVFDYGMGQADAHVPLGDSFFNIWLHGHEDRFLIEPSVRTAFGGGGHYPDPTWRMVADAFVAPVGCEISEIRPLSRIGGAWQAHFTCPPGVDFHALARPQRKDLQAGKPIHP
jgi:hypothetical protein